MRIELSEGLLRQIVTALQDQPYKTAAPALDELQRAINEVQRIPDSIPEPEALQKRNGGHRKEAETG